jgi:hypothetical protein
VFEFWPWSIASLQARIRAVVSRLLPAQRLPKCNNDVGCKDQRVSRQEHNREHSPFV